GDGALLRDRGTWPGGRLVSDIPWCHRLFVRGETRADCSSSPGLARISRDARRPLAALDRGWRASACGSQRLPGPARRGDPVRVGDCGQSCMTVSKRSPRTGLGLELEGYFDDTGTHLWSPLTGFGGLVGDVAAWAELETRWPAILKRYEL